MIFISSALKTFLSCRTLARAANMSCTDNMAYNTVVVTRAKEPEEETQQRATILCSDNVAYSMEECDIKRDSILCADNIAYCTVGVGFVRSTEVELAHPRMVTYYNLNRARSTHSQGSCYFNVYDEINC